MWKDEQEVRAVLQRAVDGPAPAVRTDVGEVIRRGRRRVLVTRLGAVASVIVAVAGIGVGASLLSSTAVSSDPDTIPPAISTSEVPTTTAPAEKLPGWTELAPHVPVTTSNSIAGLPNGSSADCFGIGPELPDPVGRAILSEDKYLPAFEVAVGRAAPGNQVVVSSRNYVNVNRGHAIVEVRSIDGKLSQVQLEAGRFGGTPQTAADFYRNESSCQRIQRKTLGDGTVLQLYPAMKAGNKYLAQSIRAFTPSGRFYRVQVGTGSFVSGVAGSMPPSPNPPTGSDGAPVLPMGQQQLVDIATALAGLG